jgi:hypothetical protein
MVDVEKLTALPKKAGIHRATVQFYRFVVESVG